MANSVVENIPHQPSATDYGSVNAWAKYEDYPNGELEALWAGRTDIVESSGDYHTDLIATKQAKRYAAARFNNLDGESTRIGKLVGLDLAPPDQGDEALAAAITALGLSSPVRAFDKAFLNKFATRVRNALNQTERDEAYDNIVEVLNKTNRKQAIYLSLIHI